MRARDIMTSPVVAVTPDASIREAEALLLSHGFSAVPVVDGQQRMIGVVTDIDLIRGRHGQARSGDAPVREVMSTPVLGMDPDAPVAALARVVVQDHLRWVPIMDGSALVGVVTRCDLLRAADGTAGRENRRRTRGVVVKTGPIVVGVDGTSAGDRALSWAMDEAVLRGAPLHVVNVWQYEPLTDWSMTSEQEARGRSEATVDNALQTVAEGRRTFPQIIRKCLRGSAAEVLEEQARGAALLVVAAHTGGGLRRIALGSTTAHCVRHSPAPVVVLPAPAARSHDEHAEFEAGVEEGAR